MPLIKVEAPRGVDRELVERSMHDSVAFLEAHDFKVEQFWLRIRRASDGRRTWAAILYPLDDAPHAVKARWRAKPWLSKASSEAN